MGRLCVMVNLEGKSSVEFGSSCQNLAFTSRKMHDKIFDEFYDEIQVELTLIL